MTDRTLNSNPSDICLLLRAHAEQRWLTAQVLPVVRQLERAGAIPDEQTGAALAYLEVLWLDARARAADTDAAHAELCREAVRGDRVLCERARRYHAAVRRLRAAVERRVATLTGSGPQPPARQRITA